jgi:hypothetical protein
MVGPIRPSLLLLLGAVTCVLLIASTNLTNLMLARSAQRVHLLRQWLTESILLAIGGGLTGILIAIWGMDILKAWNPGYIPRLYSVSIDIWAMGFTLTLSLIIGIGPGFLTSFRGPHADLRSSLTGHNRGTADAAAFWLAGQASDHLKISMPSVSNDLTDLRKEAVFALTQSEDDGVPMLIHIAQTHSNVQVRA